MRWCMADHADPVACALADRHYSRKTVGAPQMMPPGRKIVLVSECGRAVWGTSWPFAQYVRHAWAGAWMCTIFRNEGAGLSSELIREAVAATRWYYGDPPALGMVTLVNAAKTHHKRDPGRCFRRAGFRHVGFTKGGLWALQLTVEGMPDAEPPQGAQLRLAGAA